MAPSPETLAALRARIATLEGVGANAGVVPLGAPGIDGALPWGGLLRGALHEIMGLAGGDGLDGAATAFAAALLARLAAGAPVSPQPASRENSPRPSLLPPPGGEDDGARGNPATPDSSPPGRAGSPGWAGAAARPVLWAAAGGRDLYAPGLVGFGLDPGGLLVVRPRRRRDILWAVEEGLRCRDLAAVLGEAHELDFTLSRRLQLAAAASGVTALLLRPFAEPLPASAAVTRWRVRAAPGGPEPLADGVGPARWRLELLRGRGARPGTWLVEWDDATGAFAVVAEAGDRSHRRQAA